MARCDYFGCGSPRVDGTHYCEDHAEFASTQHKGWGDGTPGAPAVVPEIRCPHCEAQGDVTRRSVKQQNTGKTMKNALLWGPLYAYLSSRSKDVVTELHCNACGMTWHVA